MVYEECCRSSEEIKRLEKGKEVSDGKEEKERRFTRWQYYSGRRCRGAMYLCI